MIHELAPNFFRLSVPLADSPLKNLNACLIKGQERHLLIDSGFGTRECYEAVVGAIKKVGADLGRMDYLISHCHTDHWGLTGTLMRETAQTSEPSVFGSQEDTKRITQFLQHGWGAIPNSMALHGFSLEQSAKMLCNHPANRHGGDCRFAFRSITDGDTLLYGDYALQVVLVPGHTPGMVSLYEPRTRIYVAMDHILGTITPNIASWHNSQDSLGQYFDSLEKTRKLDISLTVTGHRELVEDTPKRIEEIREHHRERLEQVLTILEKGPSNAYTVAAGMTWSVRAKSWEEFPLPQKWFATGEAIAHLEHLEHTGQVQSRLENGQRVFQRTNKMRSVSIADYSKKKNPGSGGTQR